MRRTLQTSFRQRRTTFRMRTIILVRTWRTPRATWPEAKALLAQRIKMLMGRRPFSRLTNKTQESKSPTMTSSRWSAT